MSKIMDSWLISTYKQKDCDLSATDLTRPVTQLWMKLHYPKPETDEPQKVSFKSFLGSALHKFIEDIDEPGVVKEFSWVKTMEDGTRIGGTADELRWRYSIKKWRLGDLKLKGDYSARKFLGIGTKSNPNPKPEQDKEILQLSIYRWLFQEMFDIDDKAVIYLFVPGHASYAKYPEVSEVWIDLLPIQTVDQLVKGKLAITRQDEIPERDCPKFLCAYCDYCNQCPYCPKDLKDTGGFKDESIK